jgi:hypothetical protein
VQAERRPPLVQPPQVLLVISGRFPVHARQSSARGELESSPSFACSAYEFPRHYFLSELHVAA